jgi:hypothetical protein
MATRHLFTPLAQVLTVAVVALGSFLSGQRVAERQHAQHAKEEKRRSVFWRELHGVSLDGALRVAVLSASKLGVPGDRELVSVETTYDDNGDVRYLARLWPPWPAGQPEPGAQPGMWRAIEVNREGRCSLTLVDDPGRDPGKPKTRRVILPPSE